MEKSAATGYSAFTEFSVKIFFFFYEEQRGLQLEGELSGCAGCLLISNWDRDQCEEAHVNTSTPEQISQCVSLAI